MLQVHFPRVLKSFLYVPRQIKHSINLLDIKLVQQKRSSLIIMIMIRIMMMMMMMVMMIIIMILLTAFPRSGSSSVNI